MKKLYAIAFGLSAATQFCAQTGSVGIGTTNPHSSSVLDVSSDSRGFLLPRLTTSAITTLSATASEGLVVYDKEQHKFLGWDGTKWQNLGFETNPAGTATGIIAQENFDSGAFSAGAGSFNFTGSGTTFVTGNGLFPATPRYSSANYGLQTSNNTGIITSGFINATAFTNNITLSLRVASFSGTSGNGADTGDIVSVAIDTGSGYSTEISLTGNSNTKWDFTDGSTATAVFDGNNSTTAIIGPKGTITVTGIPNTIKGLKITMLNNSADEMWVIDDVKLTAQ